MTPAFVAKTMYKTKKIPRLQDSDELGNCVHMCTLQTSMKNTIYVQHKHTLFVLWLVLAMDFAGVDCHRSKSYYHKYVFGVFENLTTVGSTTKGLVNQNNELLDLNKPYQ
jgi:hypothetical protein